MKITFANCVKELTCRGCGHRWGVGINVTRAGLSTPCRACGLRTLARGERDSLKASRKPSRARVDPETVQAVQEPKADPVLLGMLERLKADGHVLDRIGECLRVARIGSSSAERDRGTPGGRLGASEDLLLGIRDIVKASGRTV